jgi:hypothetical protein
VKSGKRWSSSVKRGHFGAGPLPIHLLLLAHVSSNRAAACGAGPGGLPRGQRDREYEAAAREFEKECPLAPEVTKNTDGNRGHSFSSSIDFHALPTTAIGSPPSPPASGLPYHGLILSLRDVDRIRARGRDRPL